MSTGTIGDLIDRGYELRVYCEQTGHTGRRCNHSSVMDLQKAAAKLGRDHGSMHDDLVGKLKCTACGSKQVTIRLHPPTGTKHANPYMKNANGW